MDIVDVVEMSVEFAVDAATWAWRQRAWKELILALDPGSRRTGFGVIVADGDRLTVQLHAV